MTKPDPFFVGWSSDISRPDRRFMLVAGIAFVAAGGAGAASIAALRPPPGRGRWDQSDIRSWTGVLIASPYPALRLTDPAEDSRTALLATAGKTALELPEAIVGQQVRVTGSPISRGHSLMIAVNDVGVIERVSDDHVVFPADETLSDLGEITLIGEILDAKCWFGAMRPGYGKTHKACAQLCVHGGLPLAFCRGGACGDGDDAPLFLDSQGQAHDRRILPLVADPVVVTGRLVKTGGLSQFRADIDAICRI